jgi:hypothetical protein
MTKVIYVRVCKREGCGNTFNTVNKKSRVCDKCKGKYYKQRLMRTLNLM